MCPRLEQFMTQGVFGFIIIRHVSSKMTDLYWKESYSSIRTHYPFAPILIVDDSSDRQFLRENIHLTNCTVLYDTEHKGRAEFLAYYYFHRLKPFSRAVIIHDSVFLHAPLSLSLLEEKRDNGGSGVSGVSEDGGSGSKGKEITGIQFLWTIPHYHDNAIQAEIHELIDALPDRVREDVRSMYLHTKADWAGGLGIMSVVDWDWLDEVEQRYHLFDNLLPVLKNREYRSALERVFGLIAYHHLKSRVKESMFGSIYQYIRWGITFSEYLSNDKEYQSYPVMKVWTGR